MRRGILRPVGYWFVVLASGHTRRLAPLSSNSPFSLRNSVYARPFTPLSHHSNPTGEPKDPSRRRLGSRRLALPEHLASRRLQLSAAEHVFHAHIRRKLKSFGHVIGLTDEGLDTLGSHEFHRRSLATNGGEDSSVTLATTTKKTTKCKVTAEGKSDAAELLGDKYNESNYESFGQNDTIAFHAEPDTNAEVPADQDEPQAQIATPDVQIMNGTISWPELSECQALVDVVGYEKGIPERKQ